MIAKLFHQLAMPLRETSAIFRILFTAIAKECDVLLSYAKEQTDQAFVRSGKDVFLFAEERGVERIQGESDRAYTKRTEKAFAFLTHSATAEGLREVIRSFTEKSFTLKELFLESWILGKASERLGLNTVLGGEHGAHGFVLHFERGLTLAEKDYLERLTEIYKPAHVACRIQARILEDWILGAPGEKLGHSTYLT